MRVLVIGGLGFVGERLTGRLEAAGHDVTVIDKRAPESGADNVIRADVRNLPAISKHFIGQDVVINLAAEHQDDVRPLSLYDEVNVGGARNVCEAAQAADVRRIIFTSSVAVYGENPLPMGEAAEPNFFNDYGRTKYEAELVYKKWQTSSADRSITIIRPTVIFGPGNRGNVYNLFRQIKYGPFLMIGNGNNIKSIAHVENVAGFLMHVLTGGADVEVYNYSDGPDLSVKDLVNLCLRALRRPALGPGLPLPIGNAIGSIADAVSSLSKRRLPFSRIRVKKFVANTQVNSEAAFRSGYRPVVELTEAVKDMIVNHV